MGLHTDPSAAIHFGGSDHRALQSLLGDPSTAPPPSVHASLVGGAAVYVDPLRRRPLEAWTGVARIAVGQALVSYRLHFIRDHGRSRYHAGVGVRSPLRASRIRSTLAARSGLTRDK